MNASVYLRRMDKPSFISINPWWRIYSASLFKVPVMIAILMQADHDPSFLDKGVFYKEYPKEVFNQNVPPLPGGHVYPIRTLLESMVSRSDNNALRSSMEKIWISGIFDQLLEDLRLKPFSVTDTNEYKLNAGDYSKIFRVLYNAGYLSPKNSEFALKLLSKKRFPGRIHHTSIRMLSSRENLVTAWIQRKAIWGVRNILCQRSSHSLGVMTRGLEYKKLNNVLATVSSIVYQRMKTAKQASYCGFVFWRPFYKCYS